jgi:hypothetical protein
MLKPMPRKVRGDGPVRSLHIRDIHFTIRLSTIFLIKRMGKSFILRALIPNHFLGRPLRRLGTITTRSCIDLIYLILVCTQAIKSIVSVQRASIIFIESDKQWAYLLRINVHFLYCTREDAFVYLAL